MPDNDYPTVIRGGPVDPDLWYNPVAQDLTAAKATLTTMKPLTAAFKALDESLSSSAVLQDDDDLVVALEANSTWMVKLHLVQNSGPTPNLKLGLSLPAGATWQSGFFIGGTSSANLQMGALPTPAVTGINGLGVDAPFEMWGTVTTVGAGDVRLQWAQNTSNPATTTIKAGSFMIAQKLTN